MTDVKTDGAALKKQLEEQRAIKDEPAVALREGHREDVLNAIWEWHKLQEQLAELKDKEMNLRKQITDLYFDVQKEGTQKQALPSGWQLKAVIKYNYSIDAASLPAVLEKLPEGTADTLIKYKPEMSKSVYAKLKPEVRQIFDECLVIKPGAPSLELIAPKE